MHGDSKLKKLLIEIKNFFFFLKYPFYKMYSYKSGEFLGYYNNWYEYIPQGWRNAFGKQLSKDLKKALKKEKALKTFRFEQIKSKWGELRLYASSYGQESSRVLSYYEVLSKGYCERCGKPARYAKTGWVEFLCEDCFVDSWMNTHAKDIEESGIDRAIDMLEADKKLARLLIEDSGSFHSVEEELQKRVDSIDWYKLWDIKREDK